MHPDHTTSIVEGRKIRCPEIGTRFGRLVVSGGAFPRPAPGGKNYYLVPVRCDCGSETSVQAKLLRSGRTKSCGCLHQEAMSRSRFKHGEAGTRLYQHWSWMKARCNNPRRPFAKDYIGRGIKHCLEWSVYENFRDWAKGNGYQQGLSLERKDVNGDYEPGNCCWIPRRDQCRNKRNTVMVEAFGERKLLSEWAQDPRCHVGWGTIKHRIKVGMSPEEAITAPSQQGVKINRG